MFMYLASVDVVDDVLHDLWLDSVHLDDAGSALHDLVEVHGPRLEDDSVAVELLLPALDAHVSVLLGAEAGQGGQESLRLLDNAVSH